MKKILLSILFIQMIFLTLISTAFSQCGRVADDLSLVLPCVEYEGQYYKINFSVYPNPADSTWLYWRFESIQLASGGASCAHLEATLNITAPCVYYAGYNLAITLEYYQNPADPNWPYWKLGSQLTLNPVTINSISGDTMQCIDMSHFSSQEFLVDFPACIQNCGEDVTCLMGCMPDFGLGSSFSLAFELYNPGTTPIDFIIPAGAWFQPDAGDVQPMLIGIDEILTVSPGISTVCVPTYCMQGDAHGPSGEDIFTIAGIAQQPCIAEILDLIRGKDISHIDSYTVQEAVWNCIDFGLITEAQRTALENL